MQTMRGLVRWPRAFSRDSTSSGIGTRLAKAFGVIERLVSTSATDLLERVLNFTEQRHEVLVSNIANASTPGYVQRDLQLFGG